MPEPKAPPAIEELPPVEGPIRMVPLRLMKPAAYNPRRISPEAEKALDASLEQFGNVGVIVWNRRTGNIVGGHQRYRSEKRKKIKTAAAYVVDVDLATEKAMNVALNSPTAQGEFDRPRLESLLDELAAARPDLSTMLGFGALREGFTPPARTVSFNATTYEPVYEVVIVCKDEREQKRVHDKLVKERYNVKVLQL